MTLQPKRPSTIYKLDRPSVVHTNTLLTWRQVHTHTHQWCGYKLHAEGKTWVQTYQTHIYEGGHLIVVNSLHKVLVLRNVLSCKTEKTWWPKDFTYYMIKVTLLQTTINRTQTSVKRSQSFLYSWTVFSWSIVSTFMEPVFTKSHH
jgi:hypothetical protein